MAESKHENRSGEAAAETRPSGVVARFADTAGLIAAAKLVRAAGYRHWDCYSPYPVHGIDRAMGTRRTILPWLVFGAGVLGAVVALLMQWWMNAIDYPLIISGKPLFSVPANIPVVFELIVLFAALTAFFGTLGLNRLPQFTHYVFSHPQFKQATTDGLFLAVDTTDRQFDAQQTAELLRSAGATEVEICHEPAEGRRLPKALPVVLVVVVLAALLPPLMIAKAREMKSDQTRLHLIQDMDFQAKYKPQATSPLFADGRAARHQVAGTVAVGELAGNEHFRLGRVDGKFAETLPIPISEVRMHRGQQMFAVYCAACHGLIGLGDGLVSQRAMKREEPKWVPPTSLQGEPIRKQAVGQIFETLTNGVRQMPSYANQISVDDRWNVILYLRALQRSQNATRDDLAPEVRNKL